MPPAGTGVYTDPDKGTSGAGGVHRLGRSPEEDLTLEGLLEQRLPGLGPGYKSPEEYERLHQGTNLKKAARYSTKSTLRMSRP